MSRGVPPSRRGGSKILKRQNSFSGFPSPSLSIFIPNIYDHKTAVSSAVPTSSIKCSKPQYVPASIKTTNVSSSSSQSKTVRTVYTSNSRRKSPSSKVFYSLPRHSAPASNPALLKSSGSGIGLYLMSRNDNNPKKVSAVETLGVSPAKFLSLPRPSRRKLSYDNANKIVAYRSLPRSSSKTRTNETNYLTDALDLLSPLEPTNLSKMQRDPADGKEDDPSSISQEPDLVKNCTAHYRNGENIHRKRSEADKLKDFPGYTKENDPKYHPLSRTVVKHDSTINRPYYREAYCPPYIPMGINYLYHPNVHDANYTTQYAIRPSTERGIVYPIYSRYGNDAEPYYPPTEYTSYPSVRNVETIPRTYLRPLQVEQNMYLPQYHIPYGPQHYVENISHMPVDNGPPNNVYYVQAPHINNVDRSNHPVSVGPNNTTHVFRSLPRPVPISYNPEYKSLPRNVTNMTEGYPVVANIDISDDPGYETFRSGSRSDSSKEFILQSCDSINRISGKENEPDGSQLVTTVEKNIEDLNYHFGSKSKSISNENILAEYGSDKGSSAVSQNKKPNKDKLTEQKQIIKKYYKDEVKYQSLPRRTRKETDQKYQSLPKRRNKGDSSNERPPPPLPKRVPRDGNEAKQQRRSVKEREKNYSSRRVLKEADTRFLNLQNIDRTPQGYGKISAAKRYPESNNQHSKSSKYIDLESDYDDGIYSKVGDKKEASHEHSQNSSYTRPLPPLPPGAKYWRENKESETIPPPLPPSRPSVVSSVADTNILEKGKIVITSNLSSVRGASTIHDFSIKNSGTDKSSTIVPSTEEDGIYSSITSPPASVSDSLSSSARVTAQNRVPISTTLDSIGSKREVAIARESSSTRRRRRAISDPRMDANVLHRLAFTVFQTPLRVDKENNNDVSEVNKAKVTLAKSTPTPVTSSSSVAKYGISERKMDLVYVTERIISVVFAVDAEGQKYVSCIRDVAHMLSSKHGDNFRVFDLSQDSEVSKYLPRVTSLGWANGLAPPLERLCSVCKALESWLNEHPQHVALLHSRNGYEKLGVVIAAYMHYCNICASTDQALDRYAMKRFFDDKIGHLKLPSQKRYVQYFAGLLSGAIRINSSPLYLHTVTLYGSPHFEPRGGCSLFIKIYQGMTPVYTSGVYSVTETMRHVKIAFDTGVQLRGDILLKAYHRRLNPASREIVFRLQFHTCAVSERVLPFSRQEIDDACDDLRFPLDGGLELSFSHSADDKSGIVSNVSCDKTQCPITAWNSYEKLGNILNTSEEHGVVSASVSHTHGPLDGSLYATVNKKRSSLTPPSPPAPTPSPHGPNGRYAASIDSGIASNNSAVPAPISPPTSNSSRASAESRGTAPVAAPSPRPTTAAGSSRVSARQLDELLAGMLLDIQSIPDLRPCHTPAPDINSIRCPDFGSGKSKARAQRNGSSSSALNGFNGSSTHDSFMDASFSTNADDIPYHARMDSKPFSYGAVTSSPLPTRHKHAPDTIDGKALPPSPSIHRKNSRDALGSTRAGLESPRLIRKMPGNVGANDGIRRSASRSPSPDTGSRGGTLRRERANTVTTRIMSGDPSPPSTLTRSTLTRSAGKLEDPFDESYSHDSLSRSYGSNMSNMSWLQMQQRKLQERRDARHRAERGPHEANVLSELRSRMMQQNNHGRECEDGYVSDTTFLSEVSRESSPSKSLHPLTINTTASSHKTLQSHVSQGRGNSAPSSPILPQQATLKQVQYVNTNVSRKFSDGTHDRERPFVAVKRLHETNRMADSSDPNTAFSQLQTSPLGHINYSTYNTTSNNKSDGLLTTIHQTPSQHTPYTKGDCSRGYNTMPITKNDESLWMSETETYGGYRPITPGFPPDTPTTPYLNQGLPPKSPTSQRKEIGVLGSPLPVITQHRVEMNGHSSPAPSLYYGQSRRSSLTSLNDSGEVISSHPKFVKDVSKYWYKPNISRDDAINMLRDKVPGTFVVRDSNSFPGAFGLALKVSTPPPNVSNKSADPSSELVRHFLIEPTSKGVRLKGCTNEPVFGSLSALVYQHSITSLALPCRLTLPERDPMDSFDTVDASLSVTRNETVQLLQQGAACNVLYLYSTDTESLTGPQAVKRAVLLMLAATTNPTVVHFKVSSQGITLTDNSRQLFFRRHYPVSTISHCGLDPEDRRWAQRNDEGVPIGSLRIFGFVAKKGASRTDNQCHVIAELDPEQPATAICNFVTKVMMTSVNRFNLV